MDFFTTLVRFFQNGGPFMYPIALVLLVGLVIAIERYLVLSAAKRANAQAFNRVMPLLKKRDYQGAVSLGRSSDAPIARIVAAGVSRMGQSGNRDDIELAMEEGVLEAMPRLEKRTPYLATLANIATLLGLLLDSLPELIQLGLLSLLAAHGKAAIFLLVHRTLHVGEERLEQRLRVLDVLVDGLVEQTGRLALLLHHVMLLLAN